MLKKIIVIPFVILAISLSVYFFNYTKLQVKMNNVIKKDNRNNGIIVDVHFSKYFLKSRLVYNLKSINSDKSKADVFRVFLQFAEEIKKEDFGEVVLSFRGKTKFLINGRYFKNLGNEYSTQNPIYIMRTFPENLMNPDKSNSYSKWTGGLLGVFQKQIEDFNDFHDKWYFNDLNK